MNLHIKLVTPDLTTLKVIRVDCPTCKKNRFMVVYLEDWYGSSMTCLRCGEKWQDGEMCYRPFERSWRPKQVAAIKEFYRRWKKHAV